MVLELWDAADEGDLRRVKDSIERGENIEGRSGVWRSTPLHQACLRGHTEVVHYLVNLGADIYSVEEKGEQPLHYAAEGGNVDIVQFLLEHGADVRCENENDDLPLHIASYYGSLDVVKFLINNKANDISSKNNFGETALHRACLTGHTSVMEYLLEIGAEIDAQDLDGFSPFHRACQANNLNVVRLLETEGADIALKTKDGESGLQLAEMYSSKNCDVAVHVRAKLKESRAEDIIYNDAYYRALEAGTSNNTRIPIMIVGQERAGKTSLKKHLLGLPFDDREPSTCGIDVDVVELTDENAEEPWVRKKVKEFITSENEMKKKVQKQAAKTISEQQSTKKYLNTASVVVDAPRLESQSQAASPSVSLPKDEIGRIKSLLQNGNSNKSPAIRAFLHDFAGQDIYYDTHFYFLKLQCLYIVVYDLKLVLENPARPRFKLMNIDVERNSDNPFLQTNLDYFLMWLTVLITLRVTLGETVTTKFPGFQLPPVLIALTNSDQFKGDLNDVKMRIRNILIKNECDFVDFCVIDSTGKSKDEVRKLRRKSYDLCKTMLEKQRQVPTKWLQFEATLSNKMIEEKLNYISVEKAREAAEACKVTDVEADAAIEFLHRQGMIVHHAESPVVVLNPQWLMNMFTEVISVHEEDYPEDPYLRRLKSEGILMQEYFDGKSHGKLLKDMMLQFGLICPWEHEEKPAFIVPSVAPLMERGKDVQDKLSTSPIASVFFRFKCGYVLPGIFTRFLVAMVNKCCPFLGGTQPRLFCNYTLLSLEHSECKFGVYIIQQLAAIKIGVLPTTQCSHRHGIMFTSYLKQVAIDCMESIKHSELFYRNIDLSLSVKCTVCFGIPQQCIRHGKATCERDECGHFWSLDDLQKCPENPSCRYAVVNPHAKFSLESVKPWLSTGSSAVGEASSEDPVPKTLRVPECRCRLGPAELIFRRPKLVYENNPRVFPMLSDDDDDVLGTCFVLQCQNKCYVISPSIPRENCYALIPVQNEFQRVDLPTSGVNDKFVATILKEDSGVFKFSATSENRLDNGKRIYMVSLLARCGRCGKFQTNRLSKFCQVESSVTRSYNYKKKEGPFKDFPLGAPVVNAKKQLVGVITTYEGAMPRGEAAGHYFEVAAIDMLVLEQRGVILLRAQERTSLPS